MTATVSPAPLFFNCCGLSCSSPTPHVVSVTNKPISRLFLLLCLLHVGCPAVYDSLLTTIARPPFWKLLDLLNIRPNRWENFRYLPALEMSQCHINMVELWAHIGIRSVQALASQERPRLHKHTVNGRFSLAVV